MSWPPQNASNHFLSQYGDAMTTRTKDERIKYIKEHAENLIDRVGVIATNKTGHNFYIGEEVRVMLVNLGDAQMVIQSVTRSEIGDRTIRMEDIDFPPNNIPELEQEKKVLQKLIEAIDLRINFLKENGKEFLNELEFNVKTAIKFVKTESNEDKVTEFLVALLKTKIV